MKESEIFDYNAASMPRVIADKILPEMTQILFWLNPFQLNQGPVILADILPSQVKTQYLQIINIVDTSITHLISVKFTTVVKGCIYTMFDMVHTAFTYGRALIVCEFLQESTKVK